MNPNFFERVWVAFYLLPLCCCYEKFKSNVEKLRLCDQKMERELDGLEIIKDIKTMSQLSTL